MVLIKDLLPKPVSVEIGEAKVDVKGLGIRSVAHLLEKYQDVFLEFFSGENLSADALITLAPEMSLDIIAMAIGAEGQEDDIADLPLESQIEILMATWKLSVPNPKKLQELLGAAMTALNKTAAADPESVKEEMERRLKSSPDKSPKD